MRRDDHFLGGLTAPRTSPSRVEAYMAPRVAPTGRDIALTTVLHEVERELKRRGVRAGRPRRSLTKIMAQITHVEFRAAPSWLQPDSDKVHNRVLNETIRAALREGYSIPEVHGFLVDLFHEADKAAGEAGLETVHRQSRRQPAR